MNQKQRMLIKNVHIDEEEAEIPGGSLFIEQGKITKVAGAGKVSSQMEEEMDIMLDGSGLIAVPGFIDTHIHGAGGGDVMDAAETALDAMASVLPQEGTTSFLATTMTERSETINDALGQINVYPNKNGCAEIVGVHLEGPFLAAEKAGAQAADFIMEPEVEQFEKWQRLSGDRIRTVTLAPEKDTDQALSRYLNSKGIVVSAGHTNAGIAVMKAAVEAGVRQVTHLGNAMSGIHHREIGVFGAALLLKELKAELIVDGIHLSDEMIALTYQTMGSDRLILVTDSIRAKYLEPGRYQLGEQMVEVSGNKATLADGTLAGSVLKMIDGVRKMTEITGAGFRDIIAMTAVNPASQLHLYDRKGSIKEGKDADILLVDEQWNIHYTVCRGTVAFQQDNRTKK